MVLVMIQTHCCQTRKAGGWFEWLTEICVWQTGAWLFQECLQNYLLWNTLPIHRKHRLPSMDLPPELLKKAQCRRKTLKMFIFPTTVMWKGFKQAGLKAREELLGWITYEKRNLFFSNCPIPKQLISSGKSHAWEFYRISQVNEKFENKGKEHRYFEK